MRKILFVLLLLLFSAPSLASPGGTDANGGHYNHDTGEYHYHHGYPEHQHVNGICPYTGQIWPLKVPEKPAYLSETDTQKNGENGFDWTLLLPEGGASALAAAGAAYIRRRRKRRKEEKAESALVFEMNIPKDTVIGGDGMPWEKDAYLEYRRKKRQVDDLNLVYTGNMEPKWGMKYTFCTDDRGEMLHTPGCEEAFIQINAADPFCPKKNFPLCNPKRPDLRWYEEIKKLSEEEKMRAG